MNTLLIDVSQVLLAAITTNSTSDELLIKHLCFNSIRQLVSKFKKYPDVVLCCDSRTYWRKEIFPYYKAHRKENRAKSTLDWNFIFKILNEVKDDLRNHFPYKVLELDGAEADDVIAILCEYIKDDVVIVSSDHDYKQLQKFANVKQYNPMLNIYVKSNNPERELKEKIIRGDKGDNIPSILSSDDVFLLKKRQSPISSSKLETWLDETDLKSIFTEEQYRNFKRNDTLINFDNIPAELKEKVIELYESATKNPRMKLYEFLVSNRMIQLLTDIGDF